MVFYQLYGTVDISSKNGRPYAVARWGVSLASHADATADTDMRPRP